MERLVAMGLVKLEDWHGPEMEYTAMPTDAGYDELRRQGVLE